jgi:hypothetical protein
MAAAVVPEEADHVQEVYLQGQVEDATGDEISSDGELGKIFAAID